MEATVPIQDITFCIKTIHRPWACHRLVQSLRKEFGEPKIVVVDDGLPEYWFSRKYPETAKHCKVIDFLQHDVGVGVVSVDPGDMRTAMHQAAFPGEDISDRPLPDVTLPFWASSK